MLGFKRETYEQKVERLTKERQRLGTQFKKAAKIHAIEKDIANIKKGGERLTQAGTNMASGFKKWLSTPPAPPRNLPGNVFYEPSKSALKQNVKVKLAKRKITKYIKKGKHYVKRVSYVPVKQKIKQQINNNLANKQNNILAGIPE